MDENIAGYVDDDGKFHITRNCPRCNKRQEVTAEQQDFIDWQSGKKLIQQAFPYLSAGQREMLITGICDACWDKMFGEEGE